MKIQQHLALLRGINVGGKNMIKMNELKVCFEKMGFTDVATYIQSGNVVFEEGETPSGELAEMISDGIEKHFSMRVSVLVMNKSELTQIAKQQPFLKEMAECPEKLHLTFLSEIPDKNRVENLKKELFLPDEFVVLGRTIYLYCPNGYGKTKLNNSFFEKKLNVSATTRNMKTVNELLKLCEKDS